MPAQWTAELIGDMHMNRITAKQLAASAGIRPEYVSAILNGRRTPKDAEQKLRAAFERMVKSNNKEE